MKKSISILCATYVFGTGIASAATAIIDFGYSNTTTPAYANAVGDNILQSNAVSIKTTTGGTLGWQFANWMSRTPSPSGSPVFAATTWDNKQAFNDFTDSLQLPAGTSDFSDVWRDGLNSFSGAGNITFSGLAAGHTYTISLGMGRATDSGSDMQISTTMGTLTGGSWFQSNGTSGSTALATFAQRASGVQAIASYDITADSAGKIQLTITNSSQYVALQFATISDNIPEPGSAALALLGLPVLTFRRRRKQ